MTKLVLMIFISLNLAACVSVKKDELSDKTVEKVSFSLAATKARNGDMTIVGSSPNCSIKWSTKNNILTHRMSCETKTQDELWAYLLGMASGLREQNVKPIYFVRYTSKDFPDQEKHLGRIFSKSKKWKKLNQENIKKEKYRKFSNTFLAKVIEKREVLSLVPKALKTAGYDFKIDQVEIGDYKMQKNKVLRPTNSKVVFKVRNPNGKSLKTQH